jgi:hypothetical protein
VAKALGCPYYYSITKKKDIAIKKWLKDKGFITAIKALGTGRDYPQIVYIMYVRVLYSIIDFAQETGQNKQARKDVNLIILLKDLTYKQLSK